MSEILANEQLHAALMAVIVVALNALGAWLSRRFRAVPIVENNWCYIQPVVAAAIAQTKEAVRTGTWGTAKQRDIIIQAMKAFTKEFTSLEGSRPNAWVMSAVNKELLEATTRASEAPRES